MAEEAPVKLIQIGPKGGTKKDGFNLVTERVVAVNPEAKQLEVELLAYERPLCWMSAMRPWKISSRSSPAMGRRSVWLRRAASALPRASGFAPKTRMRPKPMPC